MGGCAGRGVQRAVQDRRRHREATAFFEGRGYQLPARPRWVFVGVPVVVTLLFAVPMLFGLSWLAGVSLLVFVGGVLVVFVIMMIRTWRPRAPMFFVGFEVLPSLGVIRVTSASGR